MKEGKLKDGKFFKFIKEKAPDAVGGILSTVADITGKETLGKLGDWFEGLDGVKKEDKEEAARLREVELREIDIIESNITERHSNDMMSDSWLSKNVRPIVLLFCLFLLFISMIMDWFGKPLTHSYISLFETVMMTVILFYFGGRTFEKVSKIRK